MKPEDQPPAAAELRARAEAAFQKKSAQTPESLKTLSPEAIEQMLHELRVHQIELQMQNEELRQAQLELDVSRARYFDLYDLAPVGYITLNESGLILQANLTAATLLGVTRSDLVKQPFSRFIQKEDADSYYLMRKQLLATGEAQPCELRLMKGDGTLFPALMAATTASDESGDPIMRVTLSDITAHKATEKRIQHLASFPNSNPNPILEFNLSGTVKYANTAANNALKQAGEFDAKLFLPKDIDSLVRGEELKQAVPIHREVTLKGHSYDEFICMSPDSATVRIFANDITERKHAEEALKKADQKLRLHFEQSPLAVIEWDVDFRVTRWNPAAGTIFGYSREEALGRHASFIIPEAYRPHVSQIWQGLVKKIGGERSTNENVCKDGSTILCEWYNTPLIDESGTFTGAASVVENITERRQAQLLLAWEKGALELISSDSSLHEVLCGLMLGLENQLRSALCSVLLLDDDGAHLRHGAAPSLPEAYNRAIDGLAIGPTVGSCGTAAHTRRQIIVSDIASDPLWADYRELALSHGLQACWSTPIFGRQKSNLGTYAIYYREPRHPSPVELEMIARVIKITRIAIERKQSEAALRDGEEKYHALFDNASDAILIKQEGLFIECNARTLEMFGCQSRDQILGHSPYEFSPRLQPNGRNSTEIAIEKINATYNGQPQFFEWIHTKLDGTPFPTEVNLIKVEVGGKALIQAIIRDISERKRAEEMIRRQNAELEARVEQRTAQLSKANKELRGHMVTRRQLEKEILEISEREQKRIGQDLHDDLGQQLAGIWCLSQLLENSLAAQKSPEVTASAKITNQLKESLELTRKLALGLYPVTLQADGLSSALEELARRTTEIFKVNCRCKSPQKLVLDYTVATHLYRIAQEAITNATKHGQAKNIEIELSSNSRHTYLTVNNDGKPMAKRMTNDDGMGLRIMKYRADMIGGSFGIESNKNHEGISVTSVTCMIHTPEK